MISTILLILGIVLVLIGLVGLVLPILPGSILVLSGLILAAWAENFEYASSVTIAVLVGLTILAHLVDFMAGYLGVKKSGASQRASMGAILGALIGIFFSLPGILIGPFIGAFIGELTVQNNVNTAARAGLGAWLGLVLGAGAKVAIGFTMIGIFIIARFF